MDRNAIRLPRMEEFDNIKAMITTVFSFLGIAHEEIRTEAGGKILMKADIPDAKYSCVASGLFGRGIVIVKAGSGEWGFAVRGERHPCRGDRF